MAIDSTQAQIKISLVDDVSKGLNLVQGAFGKLVKTGGMVTAAISGVGSVLSSVGLGFAVKTASNLQDLAVSFETLTGSAEKGRDLFKELKAMGASTPFEVSDLANATKTMLSFGISVDDSQKYLKILGDVSLGNKEKLSGLSLAFAQVQSTGKLMGQDLLQMINQGFNPLNEISKKTGKSMATLKDEMAEGKITAKMVADAFESATKEGGLFYQGMEKGSKTLSGTFSTMIDNIKNASAGLVGLSNDGTIVEGSFLSLVQKGINKFNEVIGSIDWVQIGNAIQTALVDIPNKASEAITSFFEFIKPLMPFFTVLGGVLVFLGSQVLSAFKYAWEKLKQPVLDLWESIKSFWQSVQPILLLLAAIFTTVILPAIQIAVGVIVNILKGLIQGIDGIIQVVTGIFNAFFGFIKGLFTGDFSQMIEGFKQIFRGLGDWLWGAIQIVLSPFRGIMDGIKNYLKGIDFFKTASEWISNLISGIKNKAGSLGSAITAPIGDAIEWVDRKLNDLLSKIGLASKKSGELKVSAGKGGGGGGSFSTGGIIPGNSFGGDRVMANVNSGEMVLNKTQQKELFNMIKGGSGGGATININNPTVRSDSDIQAIAQAVSRVLAQDLENKRFGV